LLGENKNMPVKLMDVKIKGLPRIIARYRRIIANIPKVGRRSSYSLAKDVKEESQRIIRTEALGTGTLASNIIVKEVPVKGNKIQHNVEVMGAANRYAPYVHNSFDPHWVHRDMLGAWLALPKAAGLRQWLDDHPTRKFVLVGAPGPVQMHGVMWGQYTAPWILKGGTKFFDRAFSKVLKKQIDVYEKEFEKLYKGR